MVWAKEESQRLEQGKGHGREKKSDKSWNYQLKNKTEPQERYIKKQVSKRQ